MIRFFINIIQYCLAIILALFGMVFLGPRMVEYVDAFMAETENSESDAEQFQALARVRELLNEKEISEVSLKDVLSIIDSEGSGEQSSAEDAELRQSRLEALGMSLSDVKELSLSDIQALRDVYEEFSSREGESTSPVAPSSAGGVSQMD